MPKARLCEALNELNFNIQEKDADLLFEEFDTDKSDGLDLDEFIRLTKKPSRLEEWIRSLPVSEVVSDAFPQRPGHDPLQSACDLTSDEFEAMLQAAKAGLARLFQGALAELRQAFRVTEARKKEDGGSKFNVIALSCGKITDFHAGIEDRIGDFAHCDQLASLRRFCSPVLPRSQHRRGRASMP